LTPTLAAAVALALITADDNASASPSTAPAAAMSQATPLDTMRKLSAATKANDRQAIDDCLTDEGEHPATSALIRSELHMNAASYRLTRAFSAAFGDQMRLKRFGFDLFRRSMAALRC